MPFGRVFAEPARLPTTHLYFLNAMGSAVSAWWRRRPIESRGANCFVHGDAMVLIRRDRPQVMREALAWPGRLAYLIDDDIAAGLDSPNLSADYRERFARFHHDFHQPLLARADLVVAPSRALAERLGADPKTRSRVSRIDPYWPAPFADQAHFEPLGQGASLRIVHLGSGSHQAALATVTPIIAGLLDRHAQAHFTYFSAKPVSPTLEAHPRARRVEPKTWPEYRRWLTRHRFHLGLYPLMPDTFDRARSINKLVEHALVGAVGVYPEDWEPARMVTGNAISAPSDPAGWGPVLEAALADRATLAGMAAGAARQLEARDYLASQRRLWGDFLAFDPAPADPR